MIRIGVTGTDTGVGKTVVTCALAAALRERGLRVVAMKPIETGVRFDDPGRDGARLARAALAPAPMTLTAPIVFSDPVSPLSAARRAGATIDLATLDQTVETASAGADALLVEGAGGLLVPVTDTASFDTLFARWSLEVLIVAANKLGTINHTRLTVVAAHAAGLHLSAIVLNSVAERPTDESSGDNLAVLRASLPGIPVVQLPWVPDVDDLSLLADHAERSGLAELMSPAPPTFVRRMM